MDEKQKPRPWAWWIVVVLVMPVIYVLSAGPLQWLDIKGCIHPKVRSVLMVFYAPLQIVAQEGPKPVRDAIRWYADLWMP